MPGANESSTMEWQDAQVRPTDVSRPPRSKKPLTPTTAFSFSNASVTAGSFRSTLPALIAAAVSFGIAAESTLSPAAKRCLRAEARADAAVLRSGDRAMQLQRVAPEGLVSERVLAEDVPPGEEEGAVVPLVAGVGGGT